MIPTICSPDELWRLLPYALAGRAVLLPVATPDDAWPSPARCPSSGPNCIAP